MDIMSASTGDEVARLWRTRKALSPALRNVAPKKINEDIVVPVSRIPALIEGLEQLSRRTGVKTIAPNYRCTAKVNIFAQIALEILYFFKIP